MRGQEWLGEFRCCWVDCAAQPKWAAFGRRVLSMDAAADDADAAEGPNAEPTAEVLLWRKGGGQCGRFAYPGGGMRAVERRQLSEWLRAVRMGDVAPRWHSLIRGKESDEPLWPAFAEAPG